jgi:glycosyltransferase involved in cell wall biosynthesis
MGGRLMRAFEALGKFQMWWTRQRLQNAWSMYHGVRRLHREHHFDVLEMPECGAEGALLTRLMRVPTVVKLHSPARLIMPTYDVRPSDITWCSAIEQRGLTGATAITSCSRFLAEEVRTKLGVRTPITVVSNGLDVEWFDSQSSEVDVFAKYALPRRDLLVVFTGRMERRKGIHLCPEIVGSILERHNVTFAFAGDDLFGIMRDTMLPALAARSLKGSVHWLGPLPLSDLRPLVRAADIYFSPSLWENCPYSCLEAMAAGKAVVAARQGGMPELIDDGVNGLLATCGDASSFVRQIEALVTDAALRARLGAAARAVIEQRHRDTQIAAQTVDVYRTAVA